MRPLVGWTKYIDEVSKILTLAYVLVESGLLREICVENYLFEQRFVDFDGVSQFFLL